MNVDTIQLAAGIDLYESSGKGVVVLASQHCYFIQLERLVTMRERAQLGFELEAHVPFDAEAMSTIVLDSEPTCVLVCNAGMVSELVSQHDDSNNTKVLAVVPHALLVADPWVGTGNRRILICDSQGIDCIDVIAGNISRWTWQAAHSLTQLVDNLPDGTDDVVVLINDQSTREAMLGYTDASHVTVIDRSDVSSTVSSILDGEVAPKYTFSDGQLDFVDSLAPARNAQLLVAWLIAVSLCLVAGSIFYRAHAVRLQASDYVAEQRSLFAESFPKQPLPVGLMTRFESERRRLLATRDGTQVPQVGSALPVLRAFLEGAKAEARFHTAMLHFVPGELEAIQCTAKSYEDLETLQSSLVEAGFALPTMRAKQSSRGVTPDWKGVRWKAGEDQTNDTERGTDGR